MSCPSFRSAEDYRDHLPCPDCERSRTAHADERATLHVELSLVDQACDKNEADFNVTADELLIIRTRRANKMLEAAQKLHNAITGRRTR